jgi:outer membrane protein
MIRFKSLPRISLAAVLLAGLVAPAAIAADITDVGYVDQAALASIPVFANANRALFAYKSQLDRQFNTALRGARTDADKQRISMQFQQQYLDKQRELVGPLFQRAQLAIAAVSASRNLSIVVDKRIVIYGGQDVTRDVETLFAGTQAIPPPAASPAPSEIGYVDQTVLDNIPKVKAANDQFTAFSTTQRALFAPKLAQAKTDDEKRQVYQQFNKTLADKQDELLKPLIEQTKNATASVAANKKLILVIDRGDVVYGGTDITADFQNALSK